MIFSFLIFFWDFGSLQASLLCIVGDLAGRGSVAVAVGVSDRWHSIGDTWHLTHGMWHVTHDFFLPFLSVSSRFGIGATIRAHQEIQCLPYARLLGMVFFRCGFIAAEAWCCNQPPPAWPQSHPESKCYIHIFSWGRDLPPPALSPSPPEINGINLILKEWGY